MSLAISPDWPRLRALFESLAGLPTSDQQAELARLPDPPDLVDRLRAMLDADGDRRLRTDLAAQAPALMSQAVHEHDRTSLIGTRLGPWRVLEEIGRGGMGEVYRACRDDGRYRAEVAVKIVARTIDGDRFRNERQTLARLDHPQIARLLDGGECADGRPYLVMDFVRGLPIDRHCAAALPTEDWLGRCRLLLAAARAVEHAHARAVLHRDLKPDNLLVDTTGQVRLLDFGVAKLLDDEGAGTDATCARYFTPKYAAPEQLAGETATTATDVYALALILHELLTGRHAFAGAQTDGNEGIARRMLAGAAPTPLRRALPQAGRDSRLRDLEAVLNKALRREPDQRYASAAAFADELQAILDDRPVQTRTATGRERCLRWLRNHRLAAASLALGVGGLLFGSAAAWWQAHTARVQRDAAIVAADRAERIAGFLTGVFQAPQPIQARGRELSARDLLDRGRQELATGLNEQPALRQHLQAVIANTYRSLGLYEPAESLLREALADGESAALLLELGWLQAFQARYEEAAELLTRAVELARDEADDTLLIKASTRLVTPLINLQRLDQAESAIEAALSALARQPRPEDDERLAPLYDLQASVAFNRGQLERAEYLYEQAMAAFSRNGGPEHPGVAMAHQNLATLALHRHDFVAAERGYRQAIAIARSHYGVDSDQIAMPMRGLTLALRRQGRFDEALDSARETARIRAAWSGDDHPEALDAGLDALELAILLGQSHRDELAKLEVMIAPLPDDHSRVCRLVSLRELSAAAPDSTRATAAAKCLHRAHGTVRATAELAVARASRFRGPISLPDDPDRNVEALIAALVPPDPALLRAHQTLLTSLPAR